MLLDYLIMLVYALGMLALGWYGMRKACNQNDFLVAGRRLGPGLYLGTMAAVVLGGASTIGTVKLGYLYGLSGLWLVFMLGLGIIVLSLVFSRQIARLKVYTVTQILEQRYQASSRLIGGIVMVAYDLMVAVTATIAIGSVTEVVFEIPRIAAILCGGGIVIVYSVIGGMWSLTLTDIVQFIIKTVGLMFILLPICLYRVGGWDELVAKLPASAFSFHTIGYDTIITYFLIYFFGILIGQDIWQRVFTARDDKVTKYAGTAAGVYCVIYGLVGALIGMCAKVLLPDLDNVNNAFAAIVSAALPDGIRGLVIAAALAAMMSTASAGLLAASTTITEDLLPIFTGQRSTRLSLNRICTLLTGIVVLGIALVVNDVLNALTLAYNLLVGGMLIPLIGAIYWKRATTAGAITSMALGFVTALVFMYKDGLDANTPIYYSLAIGLVSFIVVSLLSPRPAPVADAA